MANLANGIIGCINFITARSLLFDICWPVFAVKPACYSINAVGAPLFRVEMV